MSTNWRDRITENAVELFSHAPDPLENTFDYPRDPGLFGPESITWLVMSDVASFIGGIRALVVQAAHPEVAAGVSDHSSYEQDPLGRLSRTASYVTATAYGSMAEVNQAIRAVRFAHRPVSGISHRGKEYSADKSDLAAWVHNALIDSFLTSYRVYGSRPMTEEEADAYVLEQTRLGSLLGAEPLPSTAKSLSSWLAIHPSVDSSPAGSEARKFLARPPLPFFVLAAYKILFYAAVATVPRELRKAVGVRNIPGSRIGGHLLIRVLRFALGFSPAWGAALDRCEQPRPVKDRIRDTSGATR